jgi:hypothetical protein
MEVPEERGDENIWTYARESDKRIGNKFTRLTN